jgi:peptide/nickel transport system substrate-binding protein
LGSREFPGLSQQREFWQTIEAQKLGNHLVRFRLAQPLASFPTALTVGILPEHALRGTTASQLTSHLFNLTPIGTGPYQLEALRSSDGTRIDAVDLRVAPVYRQRPEGQSGFAVERVRFRLFESAEEAINALTTGQVDGFAARNMNERADLTQIGGVNIYTDIEPTVAMLIYNWDEEDNERFFSDPRVRSGLQLGLNQRNIVENNLVNRAIVAESPLLFASWAYEQGLQWPATDPARALDLLRTVIQRFENSEATEEATPYNFSILTNDDPTNNRIAQEIATQWSQYGLSVTVESVDEATYRQRLEDAEFDTVIVELPLGTDPDVFAYWHISQYPDGLNYGGAADDRLSELLERARRESNGLNRIDLYHDVQQVFMDRAVAIPLYYPLYTYAVSDRIKNVQLGYIGQPSDRLRTLQDWQISES